MTSCARPSGRSRRRTFHGIPRSHPRSDNRNFQPTKQDSHARATAGIEHRIALDHLDGGVCATFSPDSPGTHHAVDSFTNGAATWESTRHAAFSEGPHADRPTRTFALITTGRRQDPGRVPLPQYPSQFPLGQAHHAGRGIAQGRASAARTPRNRTRVALPAVERTARGPIGVDIKGWCADPQMGRTARSDGPLPCRA